MNPIDVLRYGDREVRSVIERYRDDDWAAIALGVWTAKDLLGHLGAFEARIADVLAGFVGEAPVTELLSADPATFNDDQAAIRAHWSIDQVRAEYDEAAARVADYAARIPAETWRAVGTIPWYGPEYSLEDLCVYQMYGHKREHAPQLSAVLERPGRSA